MSLGVLAIIAQLCISSSSSGYESRIYSADCQIKMVKCVKNSKVSELYGDVILTECILQKKTQPDN